jgi:hypothetical protein
MRLSALSRRARRGLVLLSLATTGLVLAACAKGTPKPRSAATTPGGTKDQSKWPVDDHSMCDYKSKPELEVVESTGPGALKPNVRRVFSVVGERDNRHKTLVCREIDTNLDGIKDVVRVFNPKGEAIREEADTNYDGKLDVKATFVAGRLAEEQVDTNYDGKPDVWKFYTDGALTRIKRDRNFDGNPDVWEVYAGGHLERIGVDDTFDGHVDRWDRDQQAVLEAEEAERKARDAVDETDAGIADGGADAGDGDGGAKAGAKKAK